MARTNVEVILSLKDKMSRQMATTSKSMGKSFKAVGIAAVAMTAAFVAGVKKVVDAASEMERSMLGLETVAEAFEIQASDATDAAKELAADGLLSVRDAAEGLKNLLATGFSLPEAIDLMNAFRDSAAFNRQGTLEFGQAIVGATQGLKNQNSIMVDNAGITKNLSNILKEAGFSASELSNVTSDLTVRTALYNGILQEASIFQGDASKLTGTYAGKVSLLKTEMFNLSVTIGELLKPVVGELTSTVTASVLELNSWITSLKTGENVIITGTRPAVESLTAAAERLRQKAIELGIDTEALSAILKFVAGVIQNTVVVAINMLIFKIELAIRVVTTLVDKLNILKNIGTITIDIVQNIREKFSKSKKRAVGGLITPSDGAVLVGERGPELFKPSTTGSVTPTNRLAKSGVSPISFNVNVGIYAGTETEKRIIAEDLYTSLVQMAGIEGKTVAALLGG